MTAVSMNAIATALGKVGSWTLAGTVLNGYTRTHAASGYRRINPFEVEDGQAPPTFTAPHSVTEWENYQHSDVNTGSALAITAEGYGEIELSWTRPNGYTRDLANVTQRVYWRDMGTSEDLNINPFSTPTGSADAGDGTTHTITGLTAGHFYALGVKVEWDDSVATHENSDAGAYDVDAGETALIGGGRGIASGEVFGTTPNFSTLIQTTDESTCFSGDPVNLRLTVNLEGPSTALLEVEVNGGGFGTDIAAVSAGTTTINRSKNSPHNYNFRIRYNDIGGGSPGPWSVERNIGASCILL